ncbi:hypothetical protein FVE85_8458 [Porphyridium purpureum]|uniref:Transmembrane protein n=1 Tax=Porphyridium purpureum TaxID=35688 RepID=A0A5J4YKN4_PORPP|nr:hypothetical protein FVE85_8458 [Porphyridium purpureum]|eukprot:POR8816..scf244_11
MGETGTEGAGQPVAEAAATAAAPPTQMIGPFKYVSEWAKHHNGILFRMLRLENQIKDAGLPSVSKADIEEFKAENPVMGARYDLNKTILMRQVQVAGLVVSSFVAVFAYTRQPAALFTAGIAAVTVPAGSKPFISFYYGSYKYDQTKPNEELGKWYLRKHGITPHPYAHQYLADPSGRASPEM